MSDSNVKVVNLPTSVERNSILEEGEGGEKRTSIPDRCCPCNPCCNYEPDAKEGRCAFWKRSAFIFRLGYCCLFTWIVLGLIMILLCIIFSSMREIDCNAFPGWSPGSDAANVPVVFATSLTGSNLYKTGGKMVYLNWQQAIGGDSSDISLPASWEGSMSDIADPDKFYQTKDDVIIKDGADGIVQDVCLGCLFCFDVQRKFVEWNKKCSNRPFHVFSWDWRRDQYETYTRFLAFVKTVSASYNNSKVQLTSFSTGGLFVWAVMNNAPGLVHSAVTIAAPFSGGVGTPYYIGNLPYTVGLSNTRLFPQASRWTMASDYGFMKSHPEEDLFAGYHQSFKDSNTGADVFLNLSNPSVWADYKFLGLDPLTAKSDQKYAFLERVLARSALFRKLLIPRQVSYPPIAIIRSKDGERMGSGNFTINLAKKEIDYASGMNADKVLLSDGTVCWDCALPPIPIPESRIFEAKGYTHRLITGDIKSVKAAMDSVGPYPTKPVPATFP